MYYSKKTKTLFRGFLATLILGTAFLTSCSNEEETTSNGEAKVVGRPSTIVDTELTQKVISFYGNVTFTVGGTATANVSGIDYNCTKLMINTDTKARGYIFSEQLTGKFLYIADVDRENYVLRTLDFVTNQEDIVSEIDQALDLYEIIVKNPVIDNPKTTNGRFWGWSCGSSYWDGGCYRTCAYYVMGNMVYSSRYSTSDLPGSKPKVDTKRDAC